MIRQINFDLITTAGADGSATGSATTPGVIAGKVLAVHVNYTNQPSTTDVTIATVHAPVVTILTLTSANTDGWFYPRTAVHDATGGALTFDGTEPIAEPVPVCDQVKVTVAQGDGAGGDETVAVSMIVETC
jgi:hypothetical protein